LESLISSKIYNHHLIVLQRPKGATPLAYY
jgi:hypothetical protein